MEDYGRMRIESKAWKEGYVEALEKALDAVETKGRFGLEKVVKELQEEIKQYKDQNEPV